MIGSTHSKSDDILDVAETRMRGGGYDSVSFRDIAAEVGIKSASVHYHFPQKADLGVAVVQRYAERFLETLGAPDDPGESPSERLARICEGYRAALFDQGLLCLCCVLGAESGALPKPVSEAVGDFFAGLLDWTARALEGEERAPSAAEVISALQGAMVLANATGRPALFNQTAEALRARLG